jgi:hypothetical protein
MRLAVFFVLAIACGNGEGAVIGDPCGTGNGCGVNPRGACILSWPGGYCTEIDCALGSCPRGSRCVTAVSFPNVPFDDFCLESCNDNGDCRDQYRCVDISTTEKVCAPTQP